MDKNSILLKLFIVVGLILTCAENGLAQESKPKDSLELQLKPYGSFRGHFAAFRDELEFQENASRIGLKLNILTKNVSVFAGIELGINLFKSNSQFNADGNTTGGFIVLENEQATQVFNTRLGYLGLDFKKWGRLSFGKQWSVYYDVSSYTDRFNIFGGRGSATYNSGTDGGTTGTGRADQAIIYRNDIGAFSFGLQLQARSTTNNYFIDGYGISASYNLTKELKIGTAYMRSLINDDFIENEALLGLDDNPSYFTAGINYASDRLIVSGIFAVQSNGDLIQTIVEQSDSTFDSATVIFDATGFELFAKYKLNEFNLIAGFNSYFPDVQKFENVEGLVLIDDGFKTEQYILGLEYIPTKYTCIYAEGRIANGKGALGIPISDVFAVGLRIDLEKLFTDKRLLN